MQRDRWDTKDRKKRQREKYSVEEKQREKHRTDKRQRGKNTDRNQHTKLIGHINCSTMEI